MESRYHTVYRVEGIPFGNAVVSTCWRYIRRVGQLLLRYFEYHRYIHVS